MFRVRQSLDRHWTFVCHQWVVRQSSGIHSHQTVIKLSSVSHCKVFRYSGILQAIIRCLHGTVIRLCGLHAVVSKLLCSHQAVFRLLSGSSCQAVVGQSSGVCQAFIGQSSVSHQTTIWQPLGICWAVIGQSSGSHWAVIRQTFDSHRIVIGMSSDNYQNKQQLQH